MLQMDSKVQADIEQRFGLSVVLVRQFSRLEFDGLAVNGYLGHIPLYRVRLEALVLHTDNQCFIP